MSSPRRALRLAARWALLLAAACAEPPDASPPAEPARWTLADTVDLRLGVVEGDDRAQVFELVSDVRLMRSGRVAVADGRREVRVFEADGRHALTLAGRGDGPREVRFLDRLMAEGDSVLVIYDSGRRRMLRFRIDGTYLDGRPLGETAIDTGEGLAVIRGGLIGLRFVRLGTMPLADGEQRLPTELIRWTMDGEAEALRPARGPELTLQSASYYHTPLGPSPFVGDWAGGGGYTPGDSAWVEFFSDGGDLVARVETGRVTRPITAEITERWAEERFRLLSSLGRPDRSLVFPWGIEPDWAERLPIYDRLRRAEDRCVWARVHPLSWDPVHTWDVIHVDRGWIAELDVPAEWDVRDVRDGRAAVLTEDDLGVDRVEVRQVVGPNVGVCRG